MAPSLARPPWEYFHEASPHSLHSFELSRLDHAAHLRKEILVLLDQWLDATACALLARWLLDLRAMRDDSGGSSAHAAALEAQPSREVPAAFDPQPSGSANTLL